jgi:hypothetical protein
MVPKLHRKGTSFRGAAQYVLHDKQANTSQRVAWTQTLNLATHNPDTAWRVMAATAMDAGRLKAQAAVKTTGRKSKDSVLHLTLSWHADEAGSLSREEMMRAAIGAITALKANGHQALIAAHTDEPQPHVHILINRVSPADGKILSSSKEKLALSRWAEAYEKERGRVLCEQRVVNNAARKRGEYTRGRKDRARHMIEQEAGNDDTPQARQAAEEQRQKDRDAGRRQRQTRNKHQQASVDGRQAFASRVKAIRSDYRPRIQGVIRDVRQAFRPTWEKLHRDHHDALEAFEADERTLIGRVKNAFRAIDFGALLRSGERRRALADAFSAVSGAGRAVFKARLERESARLARQQLDAERKAARPLRGEMADEIRKARSRILVAKADQKLAEQMDEAVGRAEWKTRRRQRTDAFAPHKRRERSAQRPAGVPDVREDFREAAASLSTDSESDAGQEERIARLAEQMREARESRRNASERPRRPRRDL